MENLTYNNFPFLKELGLEAENRGVLLDEKWIGDGEAVTSYNPNTGEAIARIRLGTVEDYEAGIQSMLKAKRAWADVPHNI